MRRGVDEPSGLVQETSRGSLANSITLCLPDTYLHVKVNLYQPERKINTSVRGGNGGQVFKATTL